MSPPRSPFEHHHDPGEDHDHDHDDRLVEELDPAQQSLADALRVSFVVLQVVMVLLVAAYLCSGVFGVASDEVAVRLRFGRIVGEGRDRIIPPGNLHFAFPYPIEENVKVPMAPRQVELRKEFWFEVSDANLGKTIEEQAGAKAGPLNPEKDGSALTGDANIVHAQWTLSYRVTDPLSYARNVGNVATADALVRAAAEEGVVLTAAGETADDMIKGRFHREALIGTVQKALDDAGSGLTVEPEAFSLVQAIIPVPVRAAYEAVIRAESEKAQMIEQAQQERSRVLGETAGESSRQLVELIRQYDLASVAGDAAAVAALDARMAWVFNRLEAPRWLALSDRLPRQAADDLWRRLSELDAAERGSDPAAAKAALDGYAETLATLGIPLEMAGMIPVSGKVAEAINEANSYRSTAVSEVQRQAMIFQNWFNVYKGNPATEASVRGKLWQEAKAQILGGDVETLYLPPGQTYLVLNRDPDVARRRTEAKLRLEEDERRIEAIRRSRAATP